MQISDQEYQAMADRLAPKSNCLKNCFKAFVIGGLICVLGQAIQNGIMALGAEKKAAGTWTSIALIFLSALLTGLALYDDLAKHGGAGTLVPITGFANSITAPAVEFKTEGLVTGLGVKMFTIAGPVLTYGISASVVFGILYYLFTL